MPPKNVHSLAVQPEESLRRARESIRSFISGDGEEDIVAWLKDLNREIPDSQGELFQIVEDDNELLNVRAMAARLLTAGVPDLPPLDYARLREHPSPLVRLGTLLGLGDCGRRDRLKDFLNDPVSQIVEEAEDLLEDA